MADEVETMAYAGSVPWHGLGVSVSNELSPAQMQEKAGLDWSVDKCDMYFSRDARSEMSGKVPGKQALVRSSDNKVLTVVGPDWAPVQNDDAFNFFGEFVMAGDMEMHTAGSLKGGQVVWALAKVKESFEVFKGDKVDSFLLFSNPHMYGKSVDVRFTPIRVVCNNTLSMALNGAPSGAYKSGHHSEFDPDQAKDTLGLAHEKFEQYREMAQFLGSKRVTAEALIEYYSTVFPRTSTKAGASTELVYENMSRNAKQAYDILDKQPGAEFGECSWWQAANSISYITDHIQGRNADNRLFSQWFGGNAIRKQMAFNKAVELANA